MGRGTVEFTVANNHDFHLAAAEHLPADQVRQTRIHGVVDAGANWMVLPEKVVQELGLPRTKPILVTFADNRIEFRDMVEEVRVELLGRHGTFTAIVEPHRSDALIGAIVLEGLDLLVDCSKQTVYPRDPERMIGFVETVR
jgi:predicted aspartyl protease